jgi:histidyl-tRNA synthetase
VPVGSEAEAAALALAESLRNSVAGLRLLSHCGGGSLRAAMKKADKSGAALALILGAEELAAGRVVVKPLRSDEAQMALEQAALVQHLKDSVAAAHD